MNTERNNKTWPCYILLLIGLTLAAPASILAQGSIFGSVHNADMSVPPDSVLRFFGFIGDTDNEIRSQECVGADFDGGFWYDDFQNFQGESVGVKYRYFFFNLVNAQAFDLDNIIPNNGFENQDVVLESADFPESVTGLYAYPQPDGSATLTWQTEPSMTWHVYRRTSASGGSFFRVDDPSGNRNNHGLTEPTFNDTDVAEGECYQYVIVTESETGAYSPASSIIEIDLSSCCQGQVGDINGVGGDEPTLGDIALLIDHMFISLTTPECLTEADVNQSGGFNPIRDNISIGDIAILIDHLFINGVALNKCLIGGP